MYHTLHARDIWQGYVGGEYKVSNCHKRDSDIQNQQILLTVHSHKTESP